MNRVTNAMYQCINMVGDNMVKTTINMPDELWKRFSIRVIEQQGGRKKNEIIVDLIDKYLEETETGREERKGVKRKDR